MSGDVDAIVLGAGIIGISTALHLTRRGRRVALIDRRPPGEETSAGNAGIIARAGVVPLAFPGLLGKLPRYAFNRSPHVRIPLTFLPRIAPWLIRLMRNATPERTAATSHALNALLYHTISEHKKLLRDAGVEDLLSEAGWLKLYRSEKSFAETGYERTAMERFGIDHQVLDPEAVAALEPHLAPIFARAIHVRDTASVSDPGAVTKAYAELFKREGGQILVGDAASFRWMARAWKIDTQEAGALSAPDAVICLGPWSMDVLEPLGYRLPFAVERGYHMHFSVNAGAKLGRPVYDADAGYVMAPMRRGMRVTTGIELAPRDAPPSPYQLDMVIPKARQAFPLNRQLDTAPWLGRRPSFADSLPVIGEAPRHRGLWVAFGHGHEGFTMGPATGRLMADLMTGEEPYIDPAPYSMARFVS